MREGGEERGEKEGAGLRKGWGGGGGEGGGRRKAQERGREWEGERARGGHARLTHQQRRATCSSSGGNAETVSEKSATRRWR